MPRARSWLGGFIDEPDYHNIGLGQYVPLTEAWQDYRYVFQAKDVAAENSIGFNFGDKTGTVWIADFTVTKGGEIRPNKPRPQERRPGSGRSGRESSMWEKTLYWRTSNGDRP